MLALAALAVCAAGAEPAFAKGHHRGHVPAAAAKSHHQPARAAVHHSAKNVGVSEKTLDGHVDDLVWATKDGKTMFVVSARIAFSFLSAPVP